MEAPIGRADRKPMVRGHLLSIPLDWLSVMQQLQRANVDRQFGSLLDTGAILVSMVKVQISSPAMDVMKHLKQASVRAEIVVQRIQLLEGSKHIDYASLDMLAVSAKALQELPTMDEHGEDGAVPLGIVRFSDARSTAVGDARLNPDKNATPTEPHAEADVVLNHLRPQVIASQRRCDTDRCPNDSQAEVFSYVSRVQVRIGSTALDQLTCDHFPRVFPFVYVHHLAAFDFNRSCSRRVEEQNLPPVMFLEHARVMSRCVEYQGRSD